MGKSITKSTVGRPTKLNDDLVVKLESIFKIGGTVEDIEERYFSDGYLQCFSDIYKKFHELRGKI